ncbi:MAG: transposase, partial [Pseudomonas sp.]|nr:transposase [Pseudomonas sp.]
RVTSINCYRISGSHFNHARRDARTHTTKLIEKGLRRIERAKASTRAKVEHPFRVIKCQFGFTKVRYKGLAKNTAQLHTLFALANLWMARKQLLSAG